MLKTELLHPEILQALGEAGHGAQVLIADGNERCPTSWPALRGCEPSARSRRSRTEGQLDGSAR